MTALRYADSLFGQNAVFSNASATHLPFKEDVFDIVLCVELLHHFDDCYLEKILGGISYLIKPGGTLICDVRNSLNPVLWHSYRKRDGRHFTLKTRSIFKMVKILKKCGFEVIYNPIHKEGPSMPYISPEKAITTLSWRPLSLEEGIERTISSLKGSRPSGLEGSGR